MIIITETAISPMSTTTMINGIINNEPGINRTLMLLLYTLKGSLFMDGRKIKTKQEGIQVT